MGIREANIVPHIGDGLFSTAFSDALGIDPQALREARKRVRDHIARTGALTGLPIEPTAPQPSLPFAFVSETPALPEHERNNHDSWHPCSYCEHKHQFQIGRIVLCADNRLRTIGNICWKRHFKNHVDIYNAATEEYRAYTRRIRFSRIKLKCAPSGKDLLLDLRDLRYKTADLCESIDGIPSRMNRVFPQLAEYLHRAIKHDAGVLAVSEKLPIYEDLEGASGQRELQKSNPNSNLRYKERLTPVHQIIGASAIIPKSRSSLSLINDACSYLAGANRLIELPNWETLSNRAFKTRADEYERLCRSSIEMVDTLIARLSEAHAFFSSKNLSGIRKWATNSNNELQLEGKWSLTSGKLRLYASHERIFELSCRAEIEIPIIPSLEQLRSGLNAS